MKEGTQPHPVSVEPRADDYAVLGRAVCAGVGRNLTPDEQHEFVVRGLLAELSLSEASAGHLTWDRCKPTRATRHHGSATAPVFAFWTD